MSHDGTMTGRGGSAAVATSAENDVQPGASPNTTTSAPPEAAAAAHARSASIGMVTTILAPESRSCRPSSSAPYIGLAVVLMPPMDATPKNTAAYSGRFGL